MGQSRALSTLCMLGTAAGLTSSFLVRRRAEISTPCTAHAALSIEERAEDHIARLRHEVDARRVRRRELRSTLDDASGSSARRLRAEYDQHAEALADLEDELRGVVRHGKAQFLVARHAARRACASH